MKTTIRQSCLFVSALLFFLFSGTAVQATQVKKTTKADTAKVATGTQKNAQETHQAKNAESKAAEINETTKRPMPVISELTIQIISVSFFVIMLLLFFYFFRHINRSGHYQHIGFQSIKLIGLILMFPGICIIALVGNGLISGSTFAALLGTIAGYVLSREDDSKSDTGEFTSLKVEKRELESKIKLLETAHKKELEELRKKLPKT